MTVEELIRKLRDVVLACPEAAQFPVVTFTRTYETYQDGIVTTNWPVSTVALNPHGEVEID